MAIDKKLIDQLLTDYKKPEDIIGESGLLLIYNSSDLRDPEALEKLSRECEINSKRFHVRVILA
jgi:hypothetical protein